MALRETQEREEFFSTVRSCRENLETQIAKVRFVVFGSPIVLLNKTELEVPFLCHDLCH